jgi:hypothetical protein
MRRNDKPTNRQTDSNIGSITASFTYTSKNTPTSYPAKWTEPNLSCEAKSALGYSRFPPSFMNTEGPYSV